MSRQEVLTTTELAELLRCDKSTIYRLANQRELPAFKIGSDWRFRIREIEAWMRKLSNSNRLQRTGS